MKPWAADLTDHIEHWSSSLGARSWWPRYVYHYTDVHNAASIIQHTAIFSRNLAQSKQLLSVDIASPSVIQNTASSYKDYVRLYFRPKTPTQYSNEGIRPLAQRKYGSHCPIPVFFMFDAFEILVMDETHFSSGNMAKASTLCDNTRDFFRSIPFDKVFHDGWYPQGDPDNIKYHRNAEVLVPNQLDLSHLKVIVCRSVAERETFLSLLTWEEAQIWKGKVRLKEQALFERKWTYVENVTVVDKVLWFQMNPSSRVKGPFKVQFEYLEDGSSMPQHLQFEREAIKPIGVKVPGAFYGTVTLRLDDCLAYQGKVVFEDIPF